MCWQVLIKLTINLISSSVKLVIFSSPPDITGTKNFSSSRLYLLWKVLSELCSYQLGVFSEYIIETSTCRGFIRYNYFFLI